MSKYSIVIKMKLYAKKLLKMGEYIPLVMISLFSENKIQYNQITTFLIKIMIKFR